MKDTESAAGTSEALARIKQGSRWLWSQGNYPVIARFLEPPAVELARLVVTPGARVLDVAAGNGNFAIAAARIGAQVTATDFSPRMIELGGARSSLEGLPVAWREADAESLPFPDSEFDLVASVFGAIFAPRPELVASELFRVVRSGGTVAMLNYGSGYFERLSGLIGRFSTSPSTTLPSPFLWGGEAEVRRRFAPYAISVEVYRGSLQVPFVSFDDWHERFATANPPLMAMKAMLPAPVFEDLVRAAWALRDESGESEYLAVVARR
jgi:SAM-dependent methyltransferase